MCSDKHSLIDHSKGLVVRKTHEDPDNLSEPDIEMWRPVSPRQPASRSVLVNLEARE